MNEEQFTLAVTPNLTPKISFYPPMHSGLDAKIVPGTTETRARLRALRTVALFEFVKGVLVVVAAISLYWVDPSDVASAFLDFLHISPDHHIAHLLLRWADILSDQSVWSVVLIASVYAALRFAEAYGLWRARAWAEWIALVSGAAYLPFEAYKVAERISVLHVTILLVNLAIVGFMLYLRVYLPRLKNIVARVH